MMIKSSTLLLAGLAVLLAAQPLKAQEPLSNETAILPVNVLSGKSTFIGLPFTDEPIGTASVSVIAGLNITASKSFTLTGNVSFVVTKSVGGTTGSKVGKKVTVNVGGSSGTTVALNAAPSGLAVGDEFVLLPTWSLGTLFGTTAANLSGLFAGASSASADVISFIDSAGTVQKRFFTTVGGARWVDTLAPTGASKNDEALDNNKGLFVTRPISKATGLVYLEGVLRKGRQRIDIVVGNNIYFHTNPRALTLATSGLYTGSSATGVAKGATTASADTVTVIDTAGVSTVYFVRTSDSTWRTAPGDATDRGTTPIAAGSAVLINRKAAAGAAEFDIAEFVAP